MTVWLIVAAVAHAIAAIGHRHSTAAAAFFVGAAILQLTTGIAYLRKPSYALRLLITGTTGLLLAIWIASRTVGIAVGHAHGPESPAILDGIAVTAEVAALAAVTAASGLARRRQFCLVTGVCVAIAATALFAASRPPVGHHADPTTSPTARPRHAPPSRYVQGHTVIPPEDEPTVAGTADAPGMVEHEHTAPSACHEHGCEAHGTVASPVRALGEHH